MINKYDDVRKTEAKHGDVSTENVDYEMLKTLKFNERTKWKDEKTKTSADTIMKIGMQIPLNIKAIHEQGITGQGIAVAIIDQPANLNHPEYKGKIKEYKTFDIDLETHKHSSYHGPAVISLLVGTNIGVAPGASIYYCATPTWRNDAKYEADALKWIVDKNKKLIESEKIKVVSISSSPSYRKNNGHLWDKALNEAVQNNILVLDCSKENTHISPCYSQLEELNNPLSFKPGFHHLGEFSNSETIVAAPTSNRTIAEVFDDNICSYSFSASGGLSWAIPFVAGLTALMWQIDNSLSAADVRKMLISKEFQTENGIISPNKIINTVIGKSKIVTRKIK